MANATLNINGIAIKSGDITVYNYQGETREYLSSSVEFLANGVGIPVNSCCDAPEDSKGGYAICRTADLSAWEYIADHRGEVVYSIETGEAFSISALGGYPEGTSKQAPATRYDVWNGSEWVTDTKAQHSAQVEDAERQKALLLVEAQSTISFWQTELQLGIISNEDKVRLVAWMNYIKAVQAVDTLKAPAIEWPELPADT